MLLDRRRLIAVLSSIAMPVGLASRPSMAQADGELVIHGPPATPSVPLAQMVQSGVLDGLAGACSFRVYRDPDEMRAGFASGRWQVAASPSYAAANLFNKGLPVRLLNIMTGGLLFLLTRDAPVERLEAMAGRELVVPFRNDMPDLVLRLIAKRRGMNPEKDLVFRYVSSPVEATQLLVAGRAAAAVLPEPSATAAVLSGRKAGISLYRSLDLQELWGEAIKSAPLLPQAGLIVSARLAERNPGLIKALHRAAKSATTWTINNPASAGRLGADYLGIQPAMIEASIPTSRLIAEGARSLKPEIETLLAALIELSPGIVGGKLPDEAFYLDVGDA